MQVGVDLNAHEGAAFFAAWDADRDGVVTLHDFAAAVEGAFENVSMYRSSHDQVIAGRPYVPPSMTLSGLGLCALTPSFSSSTSRDSVRAQLRKRLECKYPSVAAAFLAYAYRYSTAKDAESPPLLSLDALRGGLLA